MFEVSLVVPIFIRKEPGLLNKVLRLEQEGERLHQIMNTLEKNYKSILNRARRFWFMIQEFEQKLTLDIANFEKEKRV